MQFFAGAKSRSYKFKCILNLPLSRLMLYNRSMLYNKSRLPATVQDRTERIQTQYRKGLIQKKLIRNHSYISASCPLKSERSSTSFSCSVSKQGGADNSQSTFVINSFIFQACRREKHLSVRPPILKES